MIMTKHRSNDMNEIKALIRKYPDWLRRRAHRHMLLAMVRRINRQRREQLGDICAECVKVKGVKGYLYLK